MEFPRQENLTLGQTIQLESNLGFMGQMGGLLLMSTEGMITAKEIHTRITGKMGCVSQVCQSVMCRKEVIDMDLHDHSIVGIEISEEDNSILLSLLRPDGVAPVQLLIAKVHKLFVDSFQLQNVILDFKVFHNRDQSFEFSRACELLDMQENIDESFSKGMVLVFFEASVGAEIACLSELPPQLIHATTETN